MFERSGSVGGGEKREREKFIDNQEEEPPPPKNQAGRFQSGTNKRKVQACFYDIIGTQVVVKCVIARHFYQRESNAGVQRIILFKSNNVEWIPPRAGPLECS